MPRHRFAELRVVHLPERVAAEIERGLERGHELVFRVRVFYVVDLGSRNTAAPAAQAVIRFDHVGDQMPECHLVGAWFVAEFVGGHGFDGGDGVLLAIG